MTLQYHLPLGLLYGFRQAERLGDLPPIVDIAYQVEANRWNGSTHLQLNVRDMRPGQAISQ